MAKTDKPRKVNLPPRDKGFQAVGQAIQALSNVEFALAMLYATLMEPGDRGLAVITFDAARDIHTKLRIMEAVGAYQLKGGTHVRFKNLINRAEKRVRFRHKLAHWTIGYWPSYAVVLRKGGEMQVALVPPIASVESARIMQGEQPIHIKQIDEFSTECTKLFQELIALFDEIKRQKEK